MRASLASRRLPLTLLALSTCFMMWLVSAAKSTEPDKADAKIRLVQAQTKNGQGPGAAAARSPQDVQAQPPGGVAPQTAGGAEVPAQPPIGADTGAGGVQAPAPASSGFGSLGGGGGAAPQSANQAAATGSTPSTSVASGSESAIRGTTDAGDFLGKSDSITGVETQKRSPIANETRIRGYHLGQIGTQSDGAFWFPARQDLDTFLSKIDSGAIRNAAVIKGPYSARYGPGFSFIDIETEGAPIYKNGYEFHGSTLFNYKTNGEQMYGRQNLMVGDPTWGFKVSYGQRTGNDYESGANQQIPSSYDSRDLSAVVGVNLTENNRIEFGYMRLDQTGLEFPGQVYDTEFLVTNSYRTRFLSEKQDYYDRLQIDGFYNRTSLAGNAQRPSKRAFIPQLNTAFTSGTAEQTGILGVPITSGAGFQGFTDIDQASSGYRAAISWGKEKETQLTLGTDFRYLNGEINEFDNFFRSALLDVAGNPLPGCVPGQGHFGVPRSHESVVGIFGEATVPTSSRLTLKAGARLDWVNTNIDNTGTDSAAFLQSTLLRSDGFERDYTLVLVYGTADYKLTEELSLVSGAGHAQRPPTQTELYATAPFLAILQQGFTTVVGNPGLASERLYQLDLGLKGDYKDFRFGVNGFASLIQDYITYQRLTNLQQGGGLNLSKIQGLLPNSITVRFINTDLATLSGMEAYGEYDLTDWLTPFAILGWVEGRDQDVGGNYLPDPNTGNIVRFTTNKAEALPGIPPLEARLGLRIHEASKAPRYGIEFATRIVDRQDESAASLREVPSAGFYTMDLRTYYNWKFSDTRSVLFTAGVENILNRNYREHLDLLTGNGVFQPGIAGYFGVELRY